MLIDLDEYGRTTSAWRKAALILLTPLPSLVASLLPALVPLQDPALGITRNTGYMLHFFLTLSAISLGSALQIRAASSVPHSDYSTLETILVAVVTSLLMTGFVTTLGFEWRFPVPFVWVTGFAPYILLFVWGHVLVLRGRLLKTDALRAPLLAFLPAFLVQSSQVVIYPIFSAIFQLVDEWGQISLTLCFPLLKHAYRTMLRKLVRRMKMGEEFAVSGVEICAAMYQSMIMQSTPSWYATAFVVGLDVIQAFVAIRFFMDRRSVVPQRALIARAVETLREAKQEISDDDLAPYSSVCGLPRVPAVVSISTTKMVALRRFTQVACVPEQVPERTVRVRVIPSREQDLQLVTQALEILQTAESIILVEYFEVMVPLVNAVFVLVASQLGSAVFNPKLRVYHDDDAQLVAAMKSLALYSALQALSVVAMHAVLWRRYRLSATTMLAFILDRHVWSLQSKLITWLPAIFQLTVVHYGVDFKLEFKYTLGRSNAT